MRPLPALEFHMRITRNAVVSIDYILTGNDGSVLDSVKGKEALASLRGTGNLSLRLDGVLEGKSAGDQLQVNVRWKGLLARSRTTGRIAALDCAHF